MFSIIKRANPSPDVSQHTHQSTASLLSAEVASGALWFFNFIVYLQIQDRTNVTESQKGRLFQKRFVKNQWKCDCVMLAAL